MHYSPVCNCRWEGLIACVNTHLWPRLLLYIIGYPRGWMLSVQKINNLEEELDPLLLSLAHPLLSCLGNCC